MAASMKSRIIVYGVVPAVLALLSFTVTVALR